MLGGRGKKILDQWVITFVQYYGADNLESTPRIPVRVTQARGIRCYERHGHYCNGPLIPERH